MNFEALNAELTRSVNLIADNGSTVMKERPKLRQHLMEAGYFPSPDVVGSIQDLSSHGRLSLMLTLNLFRALNFRGWKAGLDDVALDVNPAQEFICMYPQQNKDTKAWIDRWNVAKDKLGIATRSTIAHRTAKPGSINAFALILDPIWKAISEFGLSYPPFAYSVDWTVTPVPRREAIALKLLKENERIEIEQRGVDLPHSLIVGFDNDLSLRNSELLKRYR
jgi:hypothetical protein